MRRPMTRLWAALLLGTALAAVQAQTRTPTQTPGAPIDSDAPAAPPGQVLSDVQPAPPEARDSSGALLLHDSRVRAQREQAFRAAGERTGIATTIGRHVSRLLARDRTAADLAQAREDANLRLREEGAGSLAPP